MKKFMILSVLALVVGSFYLVSLTPSVSPSSSMTLADTGEYLLQESFHQEHFVQEIKNTSCDTHTDCQLEVAAPVTWNSWLKSKSYATQLHFIGFMELALQYTKRLAPRSKDK